ncbi:MAG: S9 family peptidase [Gammaproteobacteria bacterium]|nr:S9 family peptidase [Gammaproteobacteria bacterium]
MPRRLIGLLGLLLAALAQAQNVPPQLPVEDFARFDEFLEVKISPDGATLALLLNRKGDSLLSTINIADGQVLGTLRDTKFEFADFDWVSDTRLVYMMAEHIAELKQAAVTGEMFAIDRDMTHQTMIYGIRAGTIATSTIIKGREASIAIPTIVSTLRNDDRRILISEQKWRVGAAMYHFDPDARPVLTLLDVHTGAKRNLGGVPLGRARVVVDNNDQPRFAIGYNEQWKLAVSWKPQPGDPWQSFSLPGFRSESVEPYGFDENDEAAFFTAIAATEAYAALYRFDLKSQAVTRVMAFPDTDVTDVVLDLSGRRIIGVSGYSDRRVRQWLDESDPAVQLYKALLRAFPNQRVEVASATADGRQAVVFVSSDVDPGQYYLFDTQTMRAVFVAAARQWVDPRQMRPKQPFELTARDGLRLHGYLTRPAGAGPFPMVVLPHGGPHGIRDYADYDPEVQLLANRGYAVLQLNFRGSGGYGKTFQEAGYREWGGRMQDDLTDATHWAIGQKIAVPDRICIYGGSYGGYAALMGVVREPDLYQCAIGHAGVYDLELMYSEKGGDIPRFGSGRNYLEKVLGTDSAVLRARSPVHNADRIKVPVLLIHGRSDWRADYEHAERMRAALEQNQKPFEWLVFGREGHGIWDEESRRQVYERILTFLDRHLMRSGAGVTDSVTSVDQPGR